MSNDEATPEISPQWRWRIVNYAVRPESDEALSWVRCSVAGQSGTTVRLTADEPASEQPALTAITGSRPAYGPHFCELGPVSAGDYTLTFEGLDLSVALWLDGRNSASVILEPTGLTTPVAPIGPADRVPHVLLLGQLMSHRGSFLALIRYVAHFGAAVTFDPEEAAGAEHAILVGAEHLVSGAVEDRLRQAGVRVERAQGDIAAQLDGAIAADTPFLFP